MNDVNTAAVSGNLTRDPELRHLPNGTAVAEFGIAVNSSRKVDDEWVEEPSFFDVTVWAGKAELVARKCRKGDKVTVQGTLKQDRWENDQGENRSKVKIIARELSGECFFRKDDQVPASTAASEPAQSQLSADDDIPF